MKLLGPRDLKGSSGSHCDQPFWMIGILGFQQRCPSQNCKVPWYFYKVSCSFTVASIVPDSQMSVPLRPTFSSYRPLWDKCTAWPRITLDTIRSNVLKCVLKLSLSPQIKPRFTLLPALCDLWTILIQVHRLDPNGIEVLRAKSTQIIFFKIPRSN